MYVWLSIHHLEKGRQKGRQRGRSQEGQRQRKRNKDRDQERWRLRPREIYRDQEGWRHTQRGRETDREGPRTREMGSELHRCFTAPNEMVELGPGPRNEQRVTGQNPREGVFWQIGGFKTLHRYQRKY